MLSNSSILGGQRLFKEARTLADAGYQVVIISNQPEDTVMPTIWDGIEICSLYRRPFPRFPGLFTLRWLWKIISIKPEVIHAHDQNTWGRAWVASRLIKAMLICDPRDFFSQTCTALRMPKFRQRYYRAKERFFHRRADRIIYPVPGLSSLAAREYNIPEPAWIANFPLGEASAPNRSLHIKFGLSDSVRFVIYSGLLSLDRCLDRLVLAARHLPEDIVIVILGAGYMRSELGGLVQRNHLEKQVKFIDEFSFENYQTYLAGADLGIAMVRADGLNFDYSWSTKVFDYLRAGLPVVYSGGPEVVRQIKENRVGRAFSDIAPEGVAAAITDVLGDREAYHRYRENVREAFLTKFNWRSEAEKLLQLYRDMAADRLIGKELQNYVQQH